MLHKCLIIDDESLARDLLAAHLAQLDNFELVAACSSAIEASHYLKDADIDLLFLDIEMPVLKGTDFYKGLINKPEVIFTTAYRDYAVDGFDLSAIDYLLKPITFARFFEAIEKYIISYKAKTQRIIHQPPITTTDSESIKNPSLFVRVNRKEVLVKLDDILYIKSLKDYVEIFTSNRKLVVKDTLSSFSEKLNQDFIRIHRSYCANITKITAYTNHDVEIDEIELPIGDTYKFQFIKKMKSGL